MVWAAVVGVDATLRYACEMPAATAARLARGPVIFAIWHNRLALSLRLHWHFVALHRRQRRMAAMVSASRDGGLLARVLELFHVQPVRGSSSRRGAQALLELTSWAEQGYDLAITPDGPRGPALVVQPGVVDLAAVTGLPIVPVTFVVSHKWVARSWDRFQIPLPFARCQARFGECVEVRRNAGAEMREAAREELQGRLRVLGEDNRPAA
jgi:hypothetical protein